MIHYPKPVNYLTKFPVPGMRNLLSSFLARQIKRFLKRDRLLLLPLVSFYKSTVRLLLTTPHTPRASRNQAGTDLEVLYLLTRSYSAGKCYACCPRSNAIINPTQLWILRATMTGVTRYAHWCDSGLHSIGITNHFLIGSMVCPMRWKPYVLTGPRTYGL